MNPLNPIYNFIAQAIVVVHRGLKPVFGDGGWGWALSIVVLVLAIRLVLVPLFVKQIKSQRTMQLMQPKIKELREKHKNDKQRLNEEMIKLQREHGNPLLGCLPMLLQIPLFIALYHVMNGFEPKTGVTATTPGAVQLHGDWYFPFHRNGLSVEQASKIADAKIFGASIASSLRSSAHVFGLLDASRTGTYVVCSVLIAVMMATTFITQKQIIGRGSPVTDPNQVLTQKLLLYVSPIALGAFCLGILGHGVAVGGLLYYVTSNVWSLGQQFVVIRRMPPVIPGEAGPASAPVKPQGPRPGLLGGRRSEPAPPPEPPSRLVQQRAVPEGGPPGSRAAGARPPRGGSASKRKKGRRGGRR